jgi:hypothetical protein
MIKNKESAARQIHGTTQSTHNAKREKIKKSLALINELHVQDSAIQDSTNSDEELDLLKSTKTQAPPVVVPLELAGCMIHFKHRLPNHEEIESLKQY